MVPTDPAAPLSAAGIAERAANILELTLRTEKPTIVALGTGRAVRAAVERVSPIDCPNHQIVSLVGNISADGSASFFDTVGRLADRTKARHYPMPLPFLMSSAGERDQMLKIDPIARVRAVAAKADLRLVGIGQMDQRAQVHVDGFVTREELLEMMRLGAVGELTGWAFDAKGRIIKGGTNAAPDQHSAAGPAASPDHRSGRRPRQGCGDPGGAEGPSDQRLDHRRGDRRRDPEAVANVPAPEGLCRRQADLGRPRHLAAVTCAVPKTNGVQPPHLDLDRVMSAV